MQTQTRYYLNEIMEGRFFDVSEFTLTDGLWQTDEDGAYYTTDEEEANFFKDLARAYEVIEEVHYSLHWSDYNDHDDIINIGKNFAEEFGVKW